MPAEVARPALFLDRDGVIIAEKHYLSDPAQVELLPGALRLIRAARARGMAVVQITNQAGIGMGLFGWEEFRQVEARLKELLAAEGVAIDAAYACPSRDPDDPRRKPNPGMLLDAARELNLDLARSIAVGDKASDILAAKRAGLPAAIHVLTGHGASHVEEAKKAADASFRVHFCRDAEEAAALLEIK